MSGVKDLVREAGNGQHTWTPQRNQDKCLTASCWLGGVDPSWHVMNAIIGHVPAS